MAIQITIRTMMNKGRSSEERFWLASETNCTTACTDPIVCPVFTFLIMACNRFGFVGFINRFIVKTFNLIRSESSFDPLTADKVAQPLILQIIESHRETRHYFAHQF
ncbi:hypothetical protein ACOME3_009745 [Neoechinorhynchus agilis]